MASPREGSESLNEMLDPHREEEREAAAMELSGRLAQKGVEVGSDEDPGQLADLLSAVEEFERGRMVGAGPRHLVEKIAVGHLFDENDGNVLLRQRQRKAQAHWACADHRDRITACHGTHSRGGRAATWRVRAP